MADFKIVTETNADMSQQMVDELGIHAIPMRFVQEEVEYENYADGRQLAFGEFYKKLRAGSMSTTSQISMDQYRKEITPYLEQGLDILHIGFSSALSGSFNTCCITAKDLMEEYPGRKIILVDTLCISMGLGLLVNYAVQQKNNGKTMEEIEQWVLNNRDSFSHWFTVDDLAHLKRGGRLSGSAALFGTMLNIKPVLTINDGKLEPVDKVRGRRQSLDYIIEKAKSGAVNPKDYMVCVLHADALDDAKYVADKLKKELKPKDVLINFVGPVIGGHAGPGTIAIIFINKELV